MLFLLIFLNCYRKVADCENYGKDYKEPMAKKNSAKGKNKNANRRKSDCFFETRFFKEKNINKKLGLKVKISTAKNGGGKVVLSYTNLAQLDKIIDILS